MVSVDGSETVFEMMSCVTLDKHRIQRGSPEPCHEDCDVTSVGLHVDTGIIR